MTSPESPSPSSAGTGEDFPQARFQALRPTAMRLGFFIGCMPLLTILPHWFLEPGMARHLLPLRGAALLLGLVHPMSLKGNAPRGLVPWLLYGPAVLLILLMLWSFTRPDGSGSKYLWVLLYVFVFTPMQGMPLKRRENALGILILFLTPNAAALAWPGLRGQVLQLDFMALPVAVVSLYLQTLFDGLLAANHAYRRQIEEMAHRDVLTGAFNRRYFMEAADLLLKRARRVQHPACLLILDIDHFKSVNDRFGHPVGDLVIRATAQTLLSTLRETDLVARVGGEEFVALLPDSDEAAGRLAAERVRTALEVTAVPADGLPEPVRFTASLGLAMLKDEGDGLPVLLERADQALYEAKRSGRNRVATSA